MKRIRVWISILSGCPLCGANQIVDALHLPTETPLTGCASLEYVWGEQEPPTLKTCAQCGLSYKNFQLSKANEREIYDLWRSSQGSRWASPVISKVISQDLMEQAKAKFWAINGRLPHNIIDVGAGEGGYLDDLTNIERFSLDINERSARENSLRGIRGVVADICSDRFEVTEKFDIVTCFDVLEHLHAPDIALKNISSLLRPGGLFIAETGNILSPLPMFGGAQNWWYVNIPEHKIFWNEDLLRTALFKWDLQVVDCHLRAHKGRSTWAPKNLVKLFLFLASFRSNKRAFRKVFMKDHLYLTSIKTS